MHFIIIIIVIFELAPYFKCSVFKWSLLNIKEHICFFQSLLGVRIRIAQQTITMMPMAAGETFPLLFYSSAKNKMEWKLTSKPFTSLSQDIFLTENIFCLALWCFKCDCYSSPLHFHSFILIVWNIILDSFFPQQEFYICYIFCVFFKWLRPHRGIEGKWKQT